MSIVVRHDLPIEEAIATAREDLAVTAAGTTAEVGRALETADTLVINPSSWDDDLLAALDEGDWVQATSTGYAAFPIEAFEARGVTFTTATGNYGAPVADHAFALTLALTRGIAAFVDDQRRREWNRSRGSDLIDLTDRTMTIVGLGDVGKSVARRAIGFGMDVYGTKRTPETDGGVLSAERIFPPEELESVIPETDVLVLTVPLTERTRGLVDRSTFERLPDSAILVNVARGPVVDRTALIEAIENDRIAGAGLDVFAEEPLPRSDPLWDLEDVIVTPHVGGRSDAFVDRFVDLFLENYDRRAAGDPMKNRIV